MTLSQFCTQCGAELKRDAKFCTSCGVQQPKLRQANSLGSVGNIYTSGSSSVSTDANGNLPICPQCQTTKLIWQKQGPPSWALPVSIVGILMIFTWVLGIPGLIIWGVGLWGILKSRQVDPYCPVCKQFFPQGE